VLDYWQAQDKARVAAKAVGSAQARLSLLRAKLDRLNRNAEIAGEAYDGAVYKLGLATKPPGATIPRRIEGHYARRVTALPEATQRLMLLAAADPTGDATLLWGAAEALGLGRTAAAPAESEQLLEIGARVGFRHPLVRSAVYAAATLSLAALELLVRLDRELAPPDLAAVLFRQ
jgi:hypothetical protein